MRNERGIRRPSICILLAAALLCGLPALVYPFGRDQGTFAFVGRMILNGAVPYRDAWDVKPPGIFYIYALAEAVFGRSMSSVRLLDIIWQTAAMFLVYAIARRISRREAPAVVAGILYIAGYWIHGFWNTAQSDGFIGLPLAAAVLIFLRMEEGKRGCAAPLVIGALVGVAFYLKYPAALMLPVFWTFLARGRRSGWLRRSVMIVAGFAAVVGGYLVYLRLEGALREFAYIQFSFVPRYMKIVSTPARHGLLSFTRLSDLLGSFPVYPPLLFFSLAAYAVAAARGKVGQAVHLVAAWALVALISLYAQGKFYIYHFLPLLPPLSIGASFALCFAFDVRRRRGARLLALSAMILVLALSMTFSNPRYARYCASVYGESWKALITGMINGRVPDDYYMNRRFTSDDFSLPADMAVARYLRERTGPGDGVFIWGVETTVYWLAGRGCPSAFVHNFALRSGWSPPRYARRLERELKEHPPRYFLVVRNDPLPWMVGGERDSAAALARYPALGKWLAENYRLETVIEDFDIFSLRWPRGAKKYRIEL